MDFNSFNRTLLNRKKIDKLRTRTMVFVLPGLVIQGSQGIEIRFPQKGKIVNIYASCSTAGKTDTIIGIERCKQVDYDTNPYWVNILTSNIVLKAGERSINTSPTPPVIAQDQVEEGDHFRINVYSVGEEVAGITVEIEVKVDITI